MKKFIAILLLGFLMSCNSNNNSESSSPQEIQVPKKENSLPTQKTIEEKMPNQIVQPKTVKADSIFEGMYSYMADANMFVSCDKKMIMPVEMKGRYIDLERQYLRAVDGGVEVYVKLKGKIKKVPSIESDEEIKVLALEEILELSKESKCP